MSTTGRAGLRLGVALLLPVLVPGAILAALWALPGDPAELVCPPGACTGTESLAARWNLDQGALALWSDWLRGAAAGELGVSWRVLPGVPVAELLGEALPVSLLLWVSAGALVVGGAGLGALPGVPGWLRSGIAALGGVPALLLALAASAVVDLRFGLDAFGEEAAGWRLLLAIPVLGLADGAFSGAEGGVHDSFRRERSERYVAAARLRGEGELGNLLPNLAGALAGQVRARQVALLSASVIVEAALRLDGVGDLLWRGVLAQDFPVVLAAATVYAAAAATLLAGQALVEAGVAAWTRWNPAEAP